MQGVFLHVGASGVNGDVDGSPMGKLPGIDIAGGNVEAFLDVDTVNVI